MQDASHQILVKGDTVRLISMPSGAISQDYPLTVGREYVIRGFVGSNVVTTCDEPGRTVDYWRGRVEKI